VGHPPLLSDEWLAACNAALAEAPALDEERRALVVT
jgi:hypothetical protein